MFSELKLTPKSEWIRPAEKVVQPYGVCRTQRHLVMGCLKFEPVGKRVSAVRSFHDGWQARGHSSWLH